MKIFNIQDAAQFDRLTLETFRFQSVSNPLYKKYIELLGHEPRKIETVAEIPFLPVEFFKSHQVISGEGTVQRVFRSSGTTGTNTSNHHLLHESIYQESLNKGFEFFYGDPAGYAILALLPSPREREDSSLVYMMDHLIRGSRHPESGFYLDSPERLADRLGELDEKRENTLLVGVSFALLDQAVHHPLPLHHTLIMETGGMKGRRKEMVREEFHTILKEAFCVDVVHSEYGMTELLSQAYSSGKGKFRTPPWMKIRIRDPYDPFHPLPNGRTGGIDVIDLANYHSCSFIQTQDLGRLHDDGSFEVLGRFDQSDVRGCNLLY